EPNKLLLVISDGAPVDDSTLSENDPDILVRHLRAVVNELVEVGDIAVAAIGIGYDVGQFYGQAGTMTTAEDLGSTLITLLEGQLERITSPV
ncbi:MAG: cobaltochelatase subunit CobT, partial [Caulobacterales bacterium]|nr:cobaltochelatase subunit CobT [Caulobacterales bacterium]